MESVIASIKYYYTTYGFTVMVWASLAMILGLYILTGVKRPKTYTNWFPKFVGGVPPKTPLPAAVKDKTTSKLEFGAKVFVENLFKRPFVRVRPDFLLNPVTGKNLELDLYNEELGLAFEINGDQHYRYTPFFHNSNKEAFYNQQYRDEIKKMKCAERGITLIEVPYAVGADGLQAHIRRQLRMEGFIV